MGTPPQVFEGDQSRAKDFLEDFKAYVRVNRGVPGFDSPIRLAALFLTFVKGHDTAPWVRDMGVWLDSLPPNFDVQQVIDQLYADFALQFQDSQETQRARQQLDNHRMTGSNVDSYVAKFEDLCRLAGYTVGNEETVYLFMQGLTEQIQKEVLRPPIPTTYYDTKIGRASCRERVLRLV